MFHNLVGNYMGDEGVRAIAEALEPRQDPNGAWNSNRARISLSLGGLYLRLTT